MNVLLFGAFDRYNYGDNLMPILLDKYIKKYHEKIYKEINIEYVSISKSDLSRYSCERSHNISDKIKTLQDGDVIISVGGEILCATNSILFLHMQKNLYLNKLLVGLKKVLRHRFSFLSDKFYSTPWEYPYLPDESIIKNDIKVIYNTVGGGFGGVKSNEDKLDVINRIKKCNYFSVRDKRTQEVFKSVINDIVLSPDSALIMSDIIDENFLNENISPAVKDLHNKKYIVLQAAPDKIDTKLSVVADELEKLSNMLGVEIVLLPIGYASTHDDFIILSKLKKYLPSALLLNDLNIWEIMYVIKNAKLHMGTSLHGVITAMSFKVPYFGLNKEVVKLDSFLNDWSVQPHNKCYSFEEISKLGCMINEDTPYILGENANKLIDLVKDNNDRIVSIIKGN